MSSMIDQLESRRLFAATLLRVGAVTADNRGTVVVRFSEAAEGVRGGAAQMYTSGTDGQLNTSDDVKVDARITYSTNKKELTIRGNLPVNTVYRIKLDGKTRIRSAATGALMDGEYTGSLASGNGKAGGNFELSTTPDTSSTPTVVMRTTIGDVRLKMHGDVAPLTAANFLEYVNAARYDGTFISRRDAGPSFVLQGGGLKVQGDATSASDVVATPQFAAVVDESALPNRLSNVVGTISFAKSGPNTATDQFFFNLADNSGLDSAARSDGGFTPFATIDANGQEILAVIDAKPLANLNSQIGTQAGVVGQPVSSAPVNDATAATASLNPVRDLQLFTRAAVVMNLVARA